MCPFLPKYLRYAFSLEDDSLNTHISSEVSDEEATTLDSWADDVEWKKIVTRNNCDRVVKLQFAKTQQDTSRQRYSTSINRASCNSHRPTSAKRAAQHDEKEHNTRKRSHWQKSTRNHDEQKPSLILELIPPDRFSACIPCRRRKIRCIPNGNSHLYNPDGTNNGICATCIRRQKECVWPKVSCTNTLTHLQKIENVAQTETKGVVECSDLGARLVDKLESPVKDSIIGTSYASRLPSAPTMHSAVSEEEEEEEEEEEGSKMLVHRSSSHAEQPEYFDLPFPAFGRRSSTPGLCSPVSSTASSSLPVTPGMEFTARLHDTIHSNELMPLLTALETTSAVTIAKDDQAGMLFDGHQS